jgi:TRAP-type C4-dicarboxylate transport system substrate-binding protein
MRTFAVFASSALRLLGLTCLCAAFSASLAQQPAPDVPLRLRVVGGLARINQYTRHEEPFWTHDLQQLSGGRATAEIVPFDRAGIRGQEMLRLVQVGAVPFGTVLLDNSAVDVPELYAPDLAGLNPNIQSLRRAVAAFRPYLEQLLRERYGARLLAVYVYPAQVSFCSKPLSGIVDLAGRRVRVSSASQADFISALGGVPVQTGFAEIVANMRSGSIDCAITGTMSGNTIGLDQVTTHIDTLPITWGLAAFVANEGAWTALPTDIQAVLRKELPKLEQSIWEESERETAEGIECNVGSDTCVSGRKGHMTAVKTTAADERRRRDVLRQKVLPAWIMRCGPPCAKVWVETVGPALGVALP